MLSERLSHSDKYPLLSSSHKVCVRVKAIQFVTKFPDVSCLGGSAVTVVVVDSSCATPVVEPTEGGTDIFTCGFVQTKEELILKPT